MQEKPLGKVKCGMKVLELWKLSVSISHKPWRYKSFLGEKNNSFKKTTSEIFSKMIKAIAPQDGALTFMLKHLTTFTT